MPRITCPGCRTSLQPEKRYVNCPWCGTPLQTAYAELAESRLPKREARLSTAEVLAIGCISLAGLSLILMGFGWPLLPAPVEREQIQVVTTGLAICQQRLARPSRSGRAQVPPRVANQGTGAEFYYEWPDGSFYFERPDGVPEPMRATCRGKIATGRLTELTLNGEDELADKAIPLY